jgi:cytochrome c oxidase subunit 2
MPRIMSNDMSSIETIMIGFTIISAPIVGLVMGITTNALMNSHRGDTPPEDGPYIRTHGPAVLVWSVVSSLFALVAVVWGIAELNTQAQAATRDQGTALVVNVTGQQWLWTFEYPQLGIKTNVLDLPVNRPVVFNVTSDDVNHSFWPVQLGVKMDANRLTTGTIDTTPTKTGPIDVRCAELCGLYHAYMQTTGEVMTSSDFNNWVTSQGGHTA